MHRGQKFLSAVTIFALGGCNGEAAKLTIRSMPAPVSAVAEPVPQRIAEARGELALGNVALALESYRKAARERPDSFEALAGMANCYDRMGRFDLSRRNYEAALALAPRNTTVLAALASSLDEQGLRDEARSVRSEISGLMASSLPTPSAPVPLRIAALNLAPTPIAPAPTRPSVATPSPKAALAVPTQAAVPALAAPQGPSTEQLVHAAPPAQPVIDSRPIQASEPAVKAADAPAIGSTVTIALAQPKATAPAASTAASQPPVVRASAPSIPIERRAALSGPSVAQMPDRAPVISAEPPVPAAPIRSVAVDPGPVGGTAPRLERLSLGEVALVTNGRPQWRAQVVERSERSTTIRFVPLRTADAAPSGLKLLNAARSQGLAANTRKYLAGRGWQQMAIGDAPKVRQNSIILYPPSRRGTAQRLALQFGFAIGSRPEGTDLVMLIGRDATRFMRARASG